MLDSYSGEADDARHEGRTATLASCRKGAIREFAIDDPHQQQRLAARQVR